MKIKVLLCNCKGLCPSFKNADMNTLPFQVESELDVQYTVVHPQFCGQGGNAVLSDVLSKADNDTYVLSGACAPEAQEKLFKKLLRVTGFPSRQIHHGGHPRHGQRGNTGSSEKQGRRDRTQRRS